jgi:hypothetical protein
MLLKFFRGSGPGEMFLILLTAIAVWASAIIQPHPAGSFYYDTNPMPLYGLLLKAIGSKAILGIGFSFLLVLLMSFLLVNFNTSHFFINERTFLPASIYILFTGIFPYYQLLNPVLPASLFLMLAIRRIMDAYRKSGTAFNFFDASLLIGTGTLFYANLVWFAILAIIGIAILRTGNLKEIVISIIGLLTPGIITAGIYYASGRGLNSFIELLRFNLFTKTGEYYFSAIIIIGLIMLGLIIITGLIFLLSHLNNKKIKARKTFSLLIWTLIISFAVYFVLPSASVEVVWLAGIPVSYILAHYLVFTRNKLFPEIIFTALIIIVAVIQILYLKS